MFSAKKVETPAVEDKKEKPTPAFLRDDYPYKAVGSEISDIDTLEPCAVYEIKCPVCEMRIRALGQKIHSTYERLNETGCPGCGNKQLVIRTVEVNKEKD